MLHSAVDERDVTGVEGFQVALGETMVFCEKAVSVLGEKVLEFLVEDIGCFIVAAGDEHGLAAQDLLGGRRRRARMICRFRAVPGKRLKAMS